MKIAKSRLRELIKEEADSIASHFQVNEEGDPQITEEEFKQLIKEEVNGLLNEIYVDPHAAYEYSPEAGMRREISPQAKFGIPFGNSDLFDPPEPAYRGPHGGRGRYIVGDPEKISDQLRSELEDTKDIRTGMQALDKVPFVDLDSPEDIPEAYLKAAAMLTLPFLFRGAIGRGIEEIPALATRASARLRGTTAAESAIAAEKAARGTRTTQHVPIPKRAPRRTPKEFESPPKPGENLTWQQKTARQHLERSPERSRSRRQPRVDPRWTKRAEEAAESLAKSAEVEAAKPPWWRLGRRGGEKWTKETMKDPTLQPKIDPTKPDIYELGSLGRKQQILRALEKALRRKPPE